MQDLPAILGGQPMFSEVVPISRTTMPDFKAVADRQREIFASGLVTNGKYVREFELKAAEYLNVAHAVAVSSNTTGLLLSLKCLDLRGDVIVPSFTFSVTGHALWWNRLRPIYVDIDPETCLINPDLVEAAITPQTSAILAVHIWGNPCQADRLQEIADRHRLALLFDSAQAFGSTYKGRRIGGNGQAEVFSCSPTKLVTSGEGGIVATNDKQLADKIRVGRNYGDDGSYDCLFEGINARMSELHAILGIASLEQIEHHIRRRADVIAIYKRELSRLPGIEFQKTTPGGASNGVYFSILVDPKRFGLDRDQIYDALAAEHIQSRKYYYPPLHQQRVNANQAGRHQYKLPHTEKVSRTALTLPLFSHMTVEQVRGICKALERIYAHRQALNERATAGKK